VLLQLIALVDIFSNVFCKGWAGVFRALGTGVDPAFPATLHPWAPFAQIKNPVGSAARATDLFERNVFSEFLSIKILCLFA
jgi:hypothetical protein